MAVLGLAEIKWASEGSSRRCDEPFRCSIWPDISGRVESSDQFQLFVVEIQYVYRGVVVVLFTQRLVGSQADEAGRVMTGTG